VATEIGAAKLSAWLTSQEIRWDQAKKTVLIGAVLGLFAAFFVDCGERTREKEKKTS